MIDHHPDRTPHPRKALAGRGRMRRRLCGHCRPVAVRAHLIASLRDRLSTGWVRSSEVAGAVNRQENASHTRDVVEESFYDTTCVRERLSPHLLSHSPTGAPSSSGRPSATVGRFGVLHLLVLQEAQQSLPSFPEKEPSLIAGRLQIPRGRRLSPSTRADSRLLLPSPSPTLPPQAAATKPSKTKDRSISAMKHRDEMTKNRRGLD